MNKNVVVKINYEHKLAKYIYQLMIVMPTTNTEEIMNEVRYRVDEIVEHKFTVLSVHI